MGGWFPNGWNNEFVLDEWWPDGAEITTLPPSSPALIDNHDHILLIGNDVSNWDPISKGMKGINYSEGKENKIGNDFNNSTALVKKIRQ